MLHNVDINKMNTLMEENHDAKQIISQLLENHHETVSAIAHEIRNPLTLVSSSLQVMEIQHPEVRDFPHWRQTIDDVEFMCQLLNELSTFNNGDTLHYSVFSIERLLKNIAVSFAISIDSEDCNGVQREHNKKLNNGLPILHKVPPKRDYGRYFCIMAEKGGTSHGGLTEKLSPFFHAKKQEVNAYGR